MREQIISRLAAERWNEIANETNELVGSKVSKSWDELPQKEKVPKAGHIGRILDAAGFFDLLEAADEFYSALKATGAVDNIGVHVTTGYIVPVDGIRDAITKAKGGAK